jgi:hypothetical protein
MFTYFDSFIAHIRKMPFLRSKSRRPELDEVEQGLLQSNKIDEGLILKTNLSTERRRRGCLGLDWSWIVQTFMLLCSSTLFLLAWYGEPSDAACTRKLFPYCKSN